MNWRLLVTPAAPGVWNMAVDEAILRAFEKNKGIPTIRLYAWEPYCISLGNAQKMQQELNMDLVQKSGIDVVKRFTGGRAVFHAKEWTYSVIGPIETGTWSDKLATTYEKIAKILALALRSLGGAADLEKGDLTNSFQKGKANRPCFASTSRSELVIHGRKLVGSAQRRTALAYVQHGSILLDRTHLEIAQYLNLGTEEQQDYRAQLEQHSISLSEVGLGGVTMEMLATAMEMAFASEMGNFPVRGDLSDLERELMNELVIKYM